MTSPASSSAASPFTGFGQSGPQASTSSQSAKTAPIKEQSYLEATPVIYPTIVPLEWSFPLIYRSKADNNDLGSNKVDSATGPGPDLQASAATPSFTQGPPSGIPPYLAAETPASLPAGPSPGNTSSFSTAGQAGNHIQKPWRIRWASYKAKAEVTAPSTDSPMSPVPIRTGRASAISTPRAGLLQVPHVYGNSPLNPISPTGSIFDKGKGRARAASDASRKSGITHYSERSRHKKRRLHGSASSLDGDSSEALLRAYYGEARQAEYDSTLEALADQKRSSALKPLLNGKRHFLRGASPTRSSDTTADGMPAELPKMISYDSVIQHGLLPERLATIDRARSMASQTGPKPRVGESRLYTFSLTSPNLDLSEYTGLDEANAYPDLEPEASGTFTASDLFPTLYNDNGIYTPPSSMHPASIHPIPSAAALSSGQNGSYGKVPFFLSSLNISSSSNTEAVAASDAFLKAVEEHILGAIQKSYHPAAGPTIAELTSGREEAPKSSKWPPSAGVICGHGILYPSNGPQFLANPETATMSRTLDTCPSLPVTSVFLHCRAQLTAADVRVSAQMQNSTLQAITVPPGKAEAPPSPLPPNYGLSASISGPYLKKGDIVLICPMSMPAVFLRWYGVTSDKVSRKQAAIERETTHIHRADILNCMVDVAVDISADEAWLLCSFGKGHDIVWPASLALQRGCRSQTQQGASQIRRKTLTTRVKSSISKASSRISRKLYFRTRASASADLVAASLNHIEQQNIVKTRERRDRAEKSMMGMTGDSETSHKATEASTKTQSRSLEGEQSGETTNTQLEAEQSQSREASPIYDSASLLNGLGCPTLESISQALDELAGPEPEITADLAPRPAILVDDVLDISDDTSQQCHKENGGVYPTPQSGPSSTNHLPLDAQESRDMAGRSTEVASFPGLDGSRTIVDILGDFTWPGYADDGRGPSGPVSSRPTSSGGGGYAPKGVFDDPSTFDLFDSAGLTEEDFSFFDSPIPSSMLEHSHSLPNTFDFHDDKLQAIHAITADDLASFVQTGPVDHFGHLMPRGAGQLVPVQPSTLQDLPGTSTNGEAATPSDNTSPVSQTEIHATSSPFHRRAVLHTTPRVDLAPGKMPNMDSQQQDIAADTVPPKYHLSLSTGRNFDLSASARNRIVDAGSVWTLKSFGPVKFRLPSPSLSVTSCSLGEHRPAWGKEEYLRQQQEKRALRIKYAYLKPAKAALTYRDTECLSRHWHEDDHLTLTSSGSTYETSSDSDSDGLKSSPDLDADREQLSFPIKELLATTLLFSLGTSIQNALAMPVHETQSAPDRSKEASAKVSRGEKEAIATIFFQHTIENIDFRERHHSQFVEPSQSLAVSPAYPVLPNAGVCKRLVNVQATEIAVSRQDAVATVSLAAVRNWPRLGLKPHNGPKDIQAVVIAPLLLVDRIVESALADWLHNVTATWESLGFGKHSTGPIDECFFKLDCGSAYLSESADWQTALARISGALTSRIAGDHTCVIYVLVDDSECESPRNNLMYLCLRLHLLRKGAIPHIIPLSALSRGFSSIPPYEHGSTHDTALSRFAFNVYDRLPVCVTRHSKDKGGPNSISTLLPEVSNLGGHFVRTFVAPAFYVAPRTLSQLALQLQWPPPALDILDASRLFHVAYQVSEDRKWLYLAATDDKAEYHCLRVRYIETLDLKVILRRVWSFMKEASESAAVQWRICISRVGTMPVNEVQAWCEILQNAMLQLAHPAMVTILSLTPVTSTTYEAPQPAASSSNTLPSLSGISLATAPEAVYVDGTVRAVVSHSPYPAAVYPNDTEESGHLPDTSERVYYALACSSVYFPTARVDVQLSKTTLKPSSDSYSLNLLAVATHPLSTYNRQLASHMIDLAQSYVDMCVIARERWALGSGETSRGAVSHLPWHLQAVTYMQTFNVDSLLQS